MSYDEVAGLLERVTGQPLLSDQTIQHVVVAKAVEVSQQWQSESQADTAAPLWPAVTAQVDWYDPQSEEVLLLTDAIQVKQQKASRGQGADKPTLERETKRVHTEVWLVEQPTGGFTYLTAGVDATGQEVVSGTERVRWQFQQHCGPERYPQGTFRDHAWRGRCRHKAWDLRAPARWLITAPLDASKMGLDLHCNNGGVFSPRKRSKRRTTGRTACLRGAQVMHFRYHQQDRTLTAAMALAPRLLTPMARTRRLGLSHLIRPCRFLALGAVETLGQVADRRLKQCHFCRQGRFALHRPRVLRLPVIRLPRELDIGLVRQHHILLSKRGDRKST